LGRPTHRLEKHVVREQNAQLVIEEQKVIRHAFREHPKALLAPLRALAETTDARLVGLLGAQLGFGFVERAKRLLERLWTWALRAGHGYLSANLHCDAFARDATAPRGLPAALDHQGADLLRLDRRA